MSQEHVRPGRGEQLRDPGPDGLIQRAFLRGNGYSAAAVRRSPVIGIANTWSELNPCNGGLRDLAAHVKRGVIASGGLPLEFPTISLAEPFIRPSSMYLRNLLAMDTEEMIKASPIDAVVLLGGCDKTLPAQIMGAASAGKPAICLGAGPRPTSPWRGGRMSIDELWPLVDERRSGKLDDDEWSTLEATLSCGFGTCNVMGTAVTMATMSEVLGMSMPGTSLLPASSAQRGVAAEATGARAVELAQQGTVPSFLITKESLRNAFTVLCAVGGSTNALLHLQAIAGRLGLRLTGDELHKISVSTPVLADVKPAGEGFLEELEAVGGIPAVIARLEGLFDRRAFAGDGRSWAQVAESVTLSDTPRLGTLAEPIGAAGSLTILSGSLAPDGALLKRSAATERLCVHRGRAVVFDGVEDLHARIDSPELDVDADSILVLRGAGPIGGPGMPEVGHLPIPKRLLAEGITDMVRISDARMSGTATGTVVLHVAPEAAIGGPLVLVRDGDWIELDADAGTLELEVDSEELAARAATVEARAPERGFGRMFHEHVLQADRGCDFGFLTSEGS